MGKIIGLSLLILAVLAPLETRATQEIILAEGFENGLEQWTKSGDVSAGSISTSGDQKYLGASALKMDYKGNSYLMLEKEIPTTTNVLFRIAYYDMGNTGATAPGVMFTIDGEDGKQTGIGINAGRVNNYNYLMRLNSVANTFDSGRPRTNEPKWHIWEIIVTDKGT
jgi:hypothetical protein